VYGQEDDPQRRCRGKQTASRFESVHARHGNIEQNDVRLEYFCCAEQLDTVLYGTDDGDRLSKLMSDDEHHLRVVIG
jgi:hypothetical protein